MIDRDERRSSAARTHAVSADAAHAHTERTLVPPPATAGLFYDAKTPPHTGLSGFDLNTQ